MINLVPITEKKRMLREFRLRVLVVSMFALGVVFLSASVSILPSLFFSSIKKNLAGDKINAQMQTPSQEVSAETGQAIAKLDAKLKLIENMEASPKFLVSLRVINEIVLKKTPNIKITKISYQNNPGEEKKISINGVAGSRDRLLLFRQTLEDNPTFKTVDLPISNFVRGSNINFFLNLIPS